MKPLYACIAALAYTFPAVAEPITMECADRATIVRLLKDGWGETGVFQGLATDGRSMLEIFARPDGTWTGFVVMPDGKACPLVSGGSWIGFGIPQGEAG